MPTAGPFSPGSIVSDATAGEDAWSNPGNAAADDGSRAEVNMNQTSERLKATNFGIDAGDIPAAATIDRITVAVKRYGDQGEDVRDHELYLVVADAIAGNNKADTVTTWPDGVGNETEVEYDYTVAQWGVSLVGSDLHNSTFGISLRAQQDGGGSDDAFVNHFYVKEVEYSTGGLLKHPGMSGGMQEMLGGCRG